MSLLQEPLDAYATLTKRIEHLGVAAAPSRRRKGVVIMDPEEELTTSLIVPAETKSNDKGKGIVVEEPKPLKKKQHIEMDEEYARKLHTEINKDTDWDVAIDHVNLKAKEDPAVQRYQVMKRKPQTEVPAATITTAPTRVAAAPSRRRKGVVIMDPKEELTTSLIIPAETKSNDKGKGIMVEEPKPLKKKQHIEMDEEYARKLHTKINKDTDWDVAIDHVNLKAKEDPANFNIEDLEALWDLVKE
nr:hypothetical protein [Tanacetum cinerariifolium]